MGVTEKPCEICGESCAGKPRIRNERGEYAHKACVESKRKGTGNAPAAAAHDDDGVMDALLGDVVQAEANVSPDGLRAGCPGCGIVLDPSVVVCTTCGFNTRTGKAMKTVVQKAPKEKKGKLTERSAAAAGASYLIGATIGAAAGSTIGAAIWAAIIIGAQVQFGLIAVLVGALSGIGAAFGARANVSVMTGLIAAVFAIAGVFGGKWYGGAAVAYAGLNKAVAIFEAQWEPMGDEERAWFVQDDHARAILITRLERGNDGGIKDFTYQMALKSEAYPDRFPVDVIEETDLWWYGMTPEEQVAYIERFPEKRRRAFDDAREGVREAGFWATVGPRDLVYFVFAVFIAGGLGANENTAPFMN